MYREELERFTLNGLSFVAYTTHDEHMGRPWEEHDGHGPVRRSHKESFTSRYQPGDKRPGERVLWAERGEFLLYDWREAIAIAKRDGWGILPERRAEWEARIGRKLTPGQIAEAAVKDDFERLRAWCNDEWHWVGVVVELLDAEGNETGESDSLWGIESDAGDYLGEIARDCADNICANLESLGAWKKGRKILNRKTAARVERIRLRA